jgi:hypothetical protein
MAIEKLQPPTFDEPRDPAEGASRTAICIWDKKVDEYVKQENYFAENMKTLYSLI